ncbi:regulatory protein RecX [Candidatus Woesebacteria bacterium]|nr:regulatory protein RecX [Candidatus Woesebacteria bacterium]
MKTEIAESLLNKAFFYLGIRVRSEHEMRQYLEKKAALFGGMQEDIEHVIARLIELDYVNDAVFVESYVRSRNNSKQKGEYVLRKELAQKGVSEEIVNHFFQTHVQDPLQLAKKALRPRWAGYSSLDPMKRTKRAQDFLLRRGFDYDTIREVLIWAQETLS